MPKHQGTSITHSDLAPTGQGFTPAQRIDKSRKFLRELFRNNGFIHLACAAINISQSTINSWRRSDPDFEEAVRDILELTHDVLEQEAYRRAMEGESETVFYQGQPVGTKQNKSDALLMWYLNNKRNYGNKRDHIRMPNPSTIEHDKNKFEFYPENLTVEEQTTLQFLLNKAQTPPAQLADPDAASTEAEPYENPYTIDQLDLNAETLPDSNQD